MILFNHTGEDKASSNESCKWRFPGWEFPQLKISGKKIQP